MLSTAGMSLWASAGDVDTGSQTIRSFYQTYSAMKTSGLPDAAGLVRLGPYFSAPLRKLIQTAQTTQARCQKKHPDEKPPWIEGDMFSSSFEGFTRFQVVTAGAPKGSATVYKVNFEYVDRNSKVAWTDEVALIKEGGRWVIDNIFYRMNSAFGNGNGPALRDGLSVNACD